VARKRAEQAHFPMIFFEVHHSVMYLAGILKSMLEYSRIQHLTIKYSEAPAALKKDCDGKFFQSGNVLHTIKAGESYVNTHVIWPCERNDEHYAYPFKEICMRLKPDSISQLSLCLALYNSQAGSEDPLEKILHGEKNDSAPAEYADLLQDTFGWLFWEHQFTNILRLFTLDLDEPHELLKQYKRRGCFIKELPPRWNIQGVPVLTSMEENMLDKKHIYRFLLKPAWEIYNCLISPCN
jgi:hypothetical protein